MSKIIPPTTLQGIIGLAASLSDEVFAQLETILQQPTSTDPSKSELQNITSASGVGVEELRYLLSFVSFLYSQTADATLDELPERLESFLQDNAEDGVDTERLTKNFVKLLRHREVHDAAMKKARLTDGFLPNVIELASFVDLRSDFERDDNGELTGRISSKIPIIQLEIRTNSDDPKERSIVLQLNEESLAQFQDTIDEMRLKLEILAAEQS